MQTAYKVSFRPIGDYFPSEMWSKILPDLPKTKGQKHPFMHIRTFKSNEEAKKFVEEQNGRLDFPSYSIKPGYSSLDVNWVKDVEGEFVIEEIKYDYLNNEHIRIFSTSQYDAHYISFSFQN